MDRTSRVELTNLCILKDGDKLLVEKKNGGVIFPGGHVETGENFRDSVIREMQEETGLTVEGPVLHGIKDWMYEPGSRYVVLLYTAEKFHGTLHSSEEGEVCWMTREEFENANVIWGMREVLKICESDTLSEMFCPFDSVGDDWDIL